MKQSNNRCKLQLLGALVLVLATIPFPLAGQAAVSLQLKPRGATRSIGWYIPQQLNLSPSPRVAATRLPPGLASPLYGVLRSGSPASPGGGAFQVILDEPPGGRPRLFVDTNGNGDLTDDPPTEWAATTGQSKLTTSAGGGWVTLGPGSGAARVWLDMYRFDPNDPERKQYRLVMFYHRDWAYEGDIVLDGKGYRAILSDENTAGDLRGTAIEVDDPDGNSGVKLLVDLNGNGDYQMPVEVLDVRKPFNIGGTTYELAGLSEGGGSFQILRSASRVAESLPPPDLAVGKVFPSFEAVDMNGKALRFPLDFRGKAVLLDFWATWCGPCMEEVPNLASTYRALSPKGFEVLGVSLDFKGQEAQVRSVTKEKGMTWRQVYDGGGWKAQLAQRFLMNSIPAAFLVDGSTGTILAIGGSLRGSSLRPAVERALASLRMDR